MYCTFRSSFEQRTSRYSTYLFCFDFLSLPGSSRERRARQWRDVSTRDSRDHGEGIGYTVDFDDPVFVMVALYTDDLIADQQGKTGRANTDNYRAGGVEAARRNLSRRGDH
jgi:hypothetical protein